MENLDLEVSARKTATFHKLDLEPLEIVEVTSGKLLKEFLDLPKSIYTDPDSLYVMPLYQHVKMMMGKLGTPEKHFFIARSKGKAVARLGVKTHDFHGTKRLHFGFFECREDFPEAAAELIDHAHKMYPHLEMMGPFHFRQEDPYIGTLVAGYEHEPYFLMPYNPPSYDSMLKRAGMSGIMDLFTYDVKAEDGLPELISKNADKCVAETGITFRQLNIYDLNREARVIAGIFNEALNGNWGFEEFDDAQINEMVMLLKIFIDPRVVVFAMVDGKEVGCLLCIPNYNPVIKPSRGGVGLGLIARFLWNKSRTKTMRGYALGVLKKYQGKGVGSAITKYVWDVGTAAGYRRGEISWILANNSPMNDLAEAMGGKQDKTYRIYSKPQLNK